MPNYYYYHYTSKAGFAGIKAKGRIKQSNQLDPSDDAWYGNGVYLTSVAPDEGKKKIITVCWGPGAVDDFLASGRVDYVFQITFTQTLGDAAKYRVYLHEGDLVLADYQWTAYKVPDKM